MFQLVIQRALKQWHILCCEYENIVVGDFKKMVAIMKIPQEQILDPTYITDMASFFNFLFMYDISPTRCKAPVLWGLKDLHNVIAR